MCINYIYNPHWLVVTIYISIYVTYILLCMYYTRSGPEDLYFLALYHISLDRFILEALTVYTHIYSACIISGVARKTSIFLYYVYIGFDGFMSGVVTVLCQELAPGKLPVNSRIVVYIYMVMLCNFLVWIHLPKRVGTTLFFCIKATTLQYLGKVVRSV